MSKFLQNLQEHLLCAIDIETTGTNPRKHDIHQICILPANGLLKPSKLFQPFIMTIIPRYPENIDTGAMHVSGKKLAQIQKIGSDYTQSSDLFFAWFEKMNLKKKIMPLACNWPFDREFIIEWLGIKTFEYCFSPIYRDVMVASAFINDKAGHLGNDFPFAYHNLGSLASKLNVERDLQHDAVSDCLTTMEIYRQLIMQY